MRMARMLHRLLVVVVGVVVLLLLAVPSFAAAAQVRYGQKPNVLFIAVDDLNHWVGHLGRQPLGKRATPNIDRLAARGVSFSRAYCAAPSCTPSRAALMSGLRPSTTGVYENGRDWQSAIAPEKCLPAQFRKGGYVALGAGKIYHGNRRWEWDDYLAEKERDANRPAAPARVRVPKGASDGVGGIKFAPLDCADSDLPDFRIADYGIEQLAKKHEKPFFLAVGLHKPHMPWNVPKKWYERFPLEEIELPPTLREDLADVPPAGVAMAKPQGDHARMVSSGRWKEAVQGYLAAIAYTDMNVGRVLDALEKSEHRDNTIVVLWGDHGWHLGEKEHWRKFALWEEATRSPLIWVVPGAGAGAGAGGMKAGATCERPVDFMSIYPTLMDLCGLPTPGHVEGKSIAALLRDPAAKWETPAVMTYLFDNHAVRSDGWRYIRYADGGEELYDHASDPLEHVNLAAKPQHAERKRELAKWMPQKNAADLGQKRRGRGEDD